MSEVMVPEDRKKRMVELEQFLRAKYNNEYVPGVQLVVDVHTKDDDEPAIQVLLAKFKAEGINMSYGYDMEREYVLIWARQPKRKV